LRNSFLPGPDHLRWKGGKRLNEDGYVRITAGPDRDKYEHRCVVNKQFLYTYGRELRTDEEVHHQNFIRSCNHDWNLIAMDAALHHGISGRSKHYGRRKGSSNGGRKDS
jgi:hypothetical protein